MNLPNIFRKRMCIRLDGDAFICIVQYGNLYGRLTRYAIDPQDREASVSQWQRPDENLVHLPKPPNDAA
jgi:hypothetical protein